jgi:ABC-type lipoprotein export system ATPase subunit
MITLSEIKKSFPDGNDRRNHVLKGINLDVAQGEFIAITGASGSGKSTLLSILGTLTNPDSGTYFLDGLSLFGGDRPVDYPAIRNRSIGFVFQDHRLMPQLCVRDNILLPTLAFQRRATAEQVDYARFLMDMTGIDRLAAQYPASLSGGEAARTALCRALVMRPAVVLADEPTGQLDAGNARTIVALLQQINGRLGTTIVMVSHAAETSAAAGRILTIRNGLLS